MKTCWRSVLGLIVVLGCEPAEKNQEKEHVDASLAQDHASMVWVEGGEFMMGAHPGDQDALPREQPRHLVKVDGFHMDRHEVTNAQFAEFVESTGYVTVAERPVDTPQGSFDPGSMTFFSPEAIFSLRDPGQWWRWTESASWKCPEGPGSTFQEVLNHPVVHIAFEDAVAYATWRGARLPTEAEWEFAATSRGEQVRFPWGSEAPDRGEVKCNVWEGPFPVSNTKLDGHVKTAPVMSYPANSLGVYDLGGNVWELCSDWYDPSTYARRSDELVLNPRGPEASFDPMENHVSKRVMRGGSFLCHPGYCSSYRVTARMPVADDTGASHVGFRCVRDSMSLVPQN